MYPIKFKPILKQHIWGGQTLLDIKRGQGLRADKSKCYGESWDVSGLDNNISVARNGFLKGNNLREIIEIYMGEMVGEAVFERYGLDFPLLLKTLDCCHRVSVQVHPDDDIAAERHGTCGKTEMWYITSAKEGAIVYIGFKNPNITREEYIEAVAQGRVADLLQSISVKKGDVFLLNSGTVHSIAGGVSLIEIQQPVDLTYRIFDWNRTDADGKPRELHTALAVDAIDFGSNVESCKIDYSLDDSGIAKLVSCDYFAANLLAVSGTMRRDYCSLDSFVLYSCTEGSATIATEGGEETIAAGEVILIPAEMNEVAINGNATIVEYYIE